MELMNTFDLRPWGLAMAALALLVLPADAAVTSSPMTAAATGPQSKPDTTGFIQIADERSRQRLRRQRRNSGGDGGSDNNPGGNQRPNHGSGGGFGGDRLNDAARDGQGGDGQPAVNARGFQPGYGRVEGADANRGVGDGYAAPPDGGYQQLQLGPQGQRAGNAGDGGYQQLQLGPQGQQAGNDGYQRLQLAPPPGNGPPPAIPPRIRSVDTGGQYQSIPLIDATRNAANRPQPLRNARGEVINGQGQVVRPVYAGAPAVGQYDLRPQRPQYQPNGAYQQLQLANGGNDQYQPLRLLDNADGGQYQQLQLAPDSQPSGYGAPPRVDGGAGQPRPLLIRNDAVQGGLNLQAIANGNILPPAGPPVVLNRNPAGYARAPANRAGYTRAPTRPAPLNRN